MSRKMVFGIAMLCAVAMVTCGACAIHLSKDAKRQINELNENMKGSREDVQGLRTELETLNENLAEIKNAVSPEALAELAAAMKRIADALEALDGKAEEFVGDETPVP